MVKEIIWAERAKEDFRDIVYYLMRDSDIVAENWVSKVEHSLDLLKSFPEMGKINPEKEITFIREIFINKYRIIYSFLNHQITILAIRHTSRPIGKI